jgi:2-amino-4-hydroxy-6-hydroxymethyldihydropteridine diphosphokinase
MSLAYLSLGSNLGDRDKYLREARQAIEGTFFSSRFSKVYETEPVDLADQPWFLNQVVEVQTDLPPDSLLEWARSLENRMGRQREIEKGPRTLDVDILLYDDKILEGTELTLPHPRLAQRRHVLIPLAELAPERRLPGSGLSVRQALEEVKDTTEVRFFVSQ